uniref:Uncharacterized protein n=1 Tax=Arundo donax TaxID=35708 RepID=A0A0A8Y102_ARUDO
MRQWAQNNRWQCGHSVSLIFTAPSLINTAEQSLNGQYNFSSPSTSSHSVTLHRSKSSGGMMSRHRSISTTPTSHPGSGHPITATFSEILAATYLPTQVLQNAWAHLVTRNISEI